MQTSDFSIDIMIRAAQAGGALVAQYFGQELEVIQKQMASDLKTRADDESEAAIIGILSEAYPEVGFYAEESGRSQSESPYYFVIDPLDGTNNFSLGLPTFVVSIALVHEQEILMGVLY